MTDLTVGSAFEDFLHMTVGNGAASARTKEIYRHGFATFAGWCRDNGVSPLTMRIPELEAYRAHLIGRGLRRGTVAINLSSVRVIFKALQRSGLRQDDPSMAVKAPKRTTEETVAHAEIALSPIEARALVRHVHFMPEDKQRDKALLILGLYHGLRVGELASVTWANFKPGEPPSLFVTGKGNKTRQVVMNHPKVVDALMAWKAVATPTETDRIFPVSKRAIQYVIEAALKAIGSKTKGRLAHCLRHTCGVISVIGGASREALAEMFGHASMTTTDIYIRAAAKYQDNPVDAIAKVLG